MSISETILLAQGVHLSNHTDCWPKMSISETILLAQGVHLRNHTVSPGCPSQKPYWLLAQGVHLSNHTDCWPKMSISTFTQFLSPEAMASCVAGWYRLLPRLHHHWHPYQYWGVCRANHDYLDSSLLNILVYYRLLKFIFLQENNNFSTNNLECTKVLYICRWMHVMSINAPQRCA